MKYNLDLSLLKRKNFAPNEFFVSDTARRLGVDNYPSPNEEQEILLNLSSTADMMQEIRTILGKSVTINSAYRCKIVNDAVGSSDRSQHKQGLACDFTCSGFGTPEEIVEFLHGKGFVADQAFNEGSWVHISRKIKGNNRMMYGYYLPDENGKRSFKAI